MRTCKRVLVVDDNTMNCKIMKEFLEEDYQVRYARSGPAAIQQVKQFQPGVILLDIMMPGMDGLETCRRIRSMQLRRRPAIIMVSALAMPSEREAGLAAGADDYIGKPFDDAELASMVRHYQEKLRDLQFC